MALRLRLTACTSKGRAMSSLAFMPVVSPSTPNSPQAVNEQSAAKTLGQLISDVQSGNVSAAQTNLSLLNQQLGSSVTSEATSPLGELLTQLDGELEGGDLAAAQASVGSFLAALTAGAKQSESSAQRDGHRGRRLGSSEANLTTPTDAVASASLLGSTETSLNSAR